MEPETRLLRYFLAVAAELNFTRAANKLHISQPSLSAQIRQLEAQLGVSLLRRNTHAASLTEAGQALSDRGPAALAGLEQAWEAARQVGRGEAGTLRLAYTLSAGHDTAPQLVQALHDTYPQITVTTEVLPTPNVLLAVRDGRADVGIARAPAPMEGARLQALRDDPLGVLVAAEHPLAARPTVELSAVADYPLVLHPRSANASHYDFIVDLFVSRGLQPSLVERDITFDLSQRCVTNGAASSLVGRSSTVGLPGNVSWVPLADAITVAVTLVLPTGEQPATVKRFLQVARAHAAAHDWLR
jgi:DNA-binding transcriptional LysR family regulator